LALQALQTPMARAARVLAMASQRVLEGLAVVQRRQVPKPDRLEMAGRVEMTEVTVVAAMGVEAGAPGVEREVAMLALVYAAATACWPDVETMAVSAARAEAATAGAATAQALMALVAEASQGVEMEEVSVLATAVAIRVEVVKFVKAETAVTAA
jgi:hypothetical protein